MLNCRQIQKLTDSCRLLAEIWIAEERCQGIHSICWDIITVEDYRLKGFFDKKGFIKLLDVKLWDLR